MFWPFTGGLLVVKRLLVWWLLLVRWLLLVESLIDLLTVKPAVLFTFSVLLSSKEVSNTGSPPRKSPIGLLAGSSLPVDLPSLARKSSARTVQVLRSLSLRESGYLADSSLVASMLSLRTSNLKVEIGGFVEKFKKSVKVVCTVNGISGRLF